MVQTPLWLVNDQNFQLDQHFTTITLCSKIGLKPLSGYTRYAPSCYREKRCTFSGLSGGSSRKGEWLEFPLFFRELSRAGPIWASGFCGVAQNGPGNFTSWPEMGQQLSLMFRFLLLFFQYRFGHFPLL